ncbi:MAG: hypothetical protein K6A72_07210 [Lachnospiraceae bacterium]|nr:hypothetical protein [Lachnospiraceae bacterium]
MASKKQEKYDLKKLPLPIRPGDPVYLVLDDDSIEAITAKNVGIDEEGIVLVECEYGEYEIGIEDRLFFTREDAEDFINGTLPDEYGIVEYENLNLPYKPGTLFYYCYYDCFDYRWEIYEEYYTYVMFTGDGEVKVGDGESECTMIGIEVDSCFDTLRKARAYVRAHPDGV